MIAITTNSSINVKALNLVVLLISNLPVVGPSLRATACVLFIIPRTRRFQTYSFLPWKNPYLQFLSAQSENGKP